MTTKNFYLGLKQVLRLYKGSSLAWSYDGSEVPTVEKLAAPVIYLDNGSGVVPNYRTAAILGKAVLGKTTLGNVAVLPKLVTPTIHISDGLVQLDTPIIYLRTSDDSGEVPAKLDAPVVRLETVEGGEEEPDTPTIPKLATPVIRLEVVSDADGEEEHTHEYVVLDHVEPTCTRSGYDDYVCAECGVDGPRHSIPALGHDWGEPYYSDEFSTGYGQRCNRCGEIEEADPPAQRLSAPTIRLEVVEDEGVPKLKPPTIELVKTLSATTLSLNDETLSWTLVSGAGHYHIIIKQQNGETGATVATAGHSYSLYSIWNMCSQLLTGVPYEIYVVAYASGIYDSVLGEPGEHSNVVTVTYGQIAKLATPEIYAETVADPIPVPAAPTASIINEDGVDYIVWTAVDGAQLYRVRYSLIIGSSVGYAWIFPDKSELKYRLNTIYKGYDYEVYVQAHNGLIADESVTEYAKRYDEAGYGEPSNTLIYTIPTTSKLATPEIRCTLPKPEAWLDGTTIYWNEVEGAEYYYIQIQGPSGQTVASIHHGANLPREWDMSQYTDTGTYWFHIGTIGPGGNTNDLIGTSTMTAILYTVE